MSNETQSPCTQSQEAILLIPGFFSPEANATRDSLLIPSLARGNRVSLLEHSVGKLGARRVTVGGGQIDVMEASWRDLADELGNKKIDQQFSRSWRLFPYWLPILRWQTFQKDRSLAVSMLLSLVLLLLWFFSTGHAALALLPKDVRENASNDVHTLFPALHLHLTPLLRGLWQFAKSPITWAVLSIIVLALRVPIMVTVADFTQRYLSNMPGSGAPTGHSPAAEEKPLVRCIHQRLADALDAVAKGGYSRVTVVGHSMGVLLAVQLLADPDVIRLVPDGVSLRLVTLGGMLPFIALKSDAVKRAAGACWENLCGRDGEWIDFYSKLDWFSTNQSTRELIKASRVIGDNDQRIQSSDARLKGSRWAGVMGRLHTAYFANETVRRSILGEPSVQCP